MSSEYDSYIQIITCRLIIMGCGSSVGQVIDSKEGLFKLEQILVMHQDKQDNIANGKIYLFGETRTQRKIIECEAKLNTVKTISSKTRIPCPKINLDPLETMYQQSQEIFHLGIYGFSTLPPFNKMLALYLQTNIIFMCGGRDYDHYNVKNQVFFYSIEDTKVMSQMSNTHINQLSPRTLTKPKYSRNRFQKMPSMSKKRYSHMGIYSNRLKSVLVFGGRNEKEETLASCQIYSILQNTWRDLPSMKLPRADGQCFEYRGKVYLFGGRSTQVKLSKKIEVFNLNQFTWTTLKFKIHRGIENALVFSQNPNQILVVGGATHFYASKTVIKINLKERTYVWDSELNREYRNAKGVRVDQDILVFGGERDTCQIFNNNKWKIGLFQHRKSVELEELQQFTFTQQSVAVRASQTIQKEKDVGVQQQNVFFGTDDYPCIIFFNKRNGQLRKQPVPMSLRLKKNMEVLELPKKVYMLLGGSDREEKKLSRSCFLYEAQSNTATESLKMSQKKINFAAVYMQGEVYVFGGYCPVQNTGYITCQKYNLDQQKWVELHRMSKPKYKTFAQKIGPNKIAVFGKQYKNQPVREIEIYHTKTDYFDCFGLKNEIPDKISMVYSVEGQNKVIILREGQDSQLQEIEITQQTLMRQGQEEEVKTIEQKLQTMTIVHHTGQKEQYVPSKQRTQQSQQLNTNILVIQPKKIEVKPLVIEQEYKIKDQISDSSSEMQKVALQEKVVIQSHDSDKKLIFISEKQIQKQMPENPLEEVYFSIDAQQLQANLSNLNTKPIITQTKRNDVTIQKNIQQKTEKVRSLKHIKQIQVVTKHQHRMVKRENQLYFFTQNDITVIDTTTNDKVTHKVQPHTTVKLFHIS